MYRMGRACVGYAPRGAGAALVGLLALAACGPVHYVGDVTRRASDAVEAARAAQAETYAPYWWTRATQYLHKAREVAAHADFQGASRFGKLATEAADHAAADARIAAGDPSRRPGDAGSSDEAPGKPPGKPPSKPPSKPTDAPVAPSRDLPAAPANDRPVPAKERPAPAREPAGERPRPRVAPAKEPP